MDEAKNMEDKKWSELLSIDGVGEILAKTIVQVFCNPSQRKIIDNLVDELEIESELNVLVSDSAVDGKVVVFTGSLERIGERLVDQIYKYGLQLMEAKY